MDNSVDLQRLLDTGRNPPSVQTVTKEVQDSERLKAILDAAYQHAVKVGIQSEMNIVRSILQDPKMERNLDGIYNFQTLMLKERVVPPVITEAKDLVQNKNGTSLKTTSAVYKIEKQAYFSTLPPNWRTYLTFPSNNYTVDVTEAPTKELMPKTSREYEAWRVKTIQGFNEGQKIANEMFEYSLNKLNRDYTGMVRFHKFVLEGKISMPTLSRADLAVSNTGSVMALDQKLLTIRTLPSFDGNMLKWKTWQAPVEYNPSQQIATINNAE